MYVLGISCYYHDSAACLLEDGQAVAAAEEERFTREKHDSSLPVNAVDYCLDVTNIDINDVNYIAFYEKPVEKFDRLLETFVTVAPFGFSSFIKGMPAWIRERLWTRKNIRSELDFDGEILFGGHHESHAASSFYASPYDEAAFITVDGVGEWNTTTWGTASNEGIEFEATLNYPHSIGLLYSAFTYYLGFKVNNGEYKLMGLSSYGSPEYTDLIRDKLLDIRPDGSFHLNMEYFSYLRKLVMTDTAFESLFGYPRREPDSELKQHHFDIAASVQQVTEDLLLNLATYVYEKTQEEHLCMAGGVALNSVANGRILEESPFKDVFIQPAAGDDGGAYGVATSVYYEGLDMERSVPPDRTAAMNGTYLGPSYDRPTITEAIEDAAVATNEFDKEAALIDRTAELIEEDNVVGLYQGRMEWGPRALGNRSILANPRNADMQDIVNRKIKFREGFRPFAPTVLADRSQEYFDTPRESPYMLFVFDVYEEKQDEIPAVTHTDGTARIQTVAREDNQSYYDLIKSFDDRTGTPVLLNTSMNRRGEPIVNTPEEAIDCFTGTNMDYMCFPGANQLVSDPE